MHHRILLWYNCLPFWPPNCRHTSIEQEVKWWGRHSWLPALVWSSIYNHWHKVHMGWEAGLWSAMNYDPNVCLRAWQALSNMTSLSLFSKNGSFFFFWTEIQVKAFFMVLSLQGYAVLSYGLQVDWWFYYFILKNTLLSKFHGETDGDHACLTEAIS